MASKKTYYLNPNRTSRSHIQIIYPESFGGTEEQLKAVLKHEVDTGKLKYVILSPLHDRDKIATKTELEDYQLNMGYQKATAQEVQEQRLHLMAEFAKANPLLTGEAFQRAFDDWYAKFLHASAEKAPKIGDLKKMHYHSLYEKYGGPIQLSTANNYYRELTRGSFVKVRDNLKGAVRYMAHLDEDMTKKAPYNPDEIWVYGDIKIDKFLTEEDKSLSSLSTWTELKEIIDDNNIDNLYDFENLMLKQDISLQLQLQKNVRLANRCKDYLYAVREKNNQARQRLGEKAATQNIKDIQEARLRRAGYTTEAARVEARKLIEEE